MIHHIAVAKLDVHVHHSQINREYVLAAKVRRVRSSFIGEHKKYKSEIWLFSHAQKDCIRK
jgi:hypothetical protein